MSHPEKATVQYACLHTVPEVGHHVVLVPVDHTSPFVSNYRPATTSKVVRVGENGEFETMNTIYKPMA